MSRRLLLRLRWSWRDLWARRLQVAAIAVVIGIGTGVYAGLSSTAEWRRASYDASYEQLAMWDLHVELAEGTSVPADDLVEVARGIDGADDVVDADPRLVLPTQVDASVDDKTILVPGRLVGVDVRDDGPRVARIHPVEGRELTSADAGRDVAVVDEHFAAHHGLAPEGRLRIAGGTPLDYVGRGLSPEHFVIIPPQGMAFGEAAYAVMWAPLDTVQRLADRPGEASSLAVTVSSGADRDRVERELLRAVDAAFPDAGATVSRQEDDPGLRTLYDDIDGDQRFNTVIAVVILAGAAFSAFNLTGRVIEAQRREIGIGLALGIRPAALASRPLLIAAQVALIGVIAGMVVGLLIQAAMAAVLDSVLPLPVWVTDFQPGVFARGALLGLVLPVAATVGPVLRAVRVPPVDAIRTTHRAATGGLAPLLRRVPLPGSSLVKLPFRNVLRAPRRTLVTSLGVAAAISTLVGVVGLMDSYRHTIARGESEVLAGADDRLLIDVEPAAVESDDVRAILDSPLLAEAETRLTLPGILEPEGEAIDVYLTVTDLESDLWRPTVEDGRLADPDRPGVVLAGKALDDLGLKVGDSVTLRHPVRSGDGIRLAATELSIDGSHPNPFRFVAYLDVGSAGLFELEGITNTIQAVPASGLSPADVQRGLFDQPGVVAVEPVRTQVEAISDVLDNFMAFFVIVQVAVLVLALLIAFGSSSINVDERRREHATMFAYGVPVRTVLAGNVVESLVTGIVGTAIGILAGRMLVSWLTLDLMADTLPDVGVIPSVSISTVLTALVMGVVAVSAAPVLTVRRLRRMDIPATLRVVE